MDLPEALAHSFIVRMWLQEEATAERGATWHGHVTHVPSGQQRYAAKLSDVYDFIAHYLGCNNDPIKH